MLTFRGSVRAGGVALAAFLFLLGAGKAAAIPIVQNVGFDVQPGLLGLGDGPAVQGPFYGTAPSVNNNSGTLLSAINTSYNITFNAAAVFGPGANNGLNVQSAVLFLDFIGVDTTLLGGTDAFTVNVNGMGFGPFNPGSFGATADHVPLVGGGSAPLGGEEDNLFITLPSSLFNDLATDTTFSITVTRTGGSILGSFTVDGANIQAVLAPEPGSIVLFGLAGLAGAGVAYRRRKRAQAA